MISPNTPDHTLLVLSEALIETNLLLGDAGIDALERAELTEKVLDILDGMCNVEAKTQQGLWAKSGAVIIYFGRTRIIHKLALSVCGDVLASS
jgi:hypothetical protein